MKKILFLLPLHFIFCLSLSAQKEISMTDWSVGQSKKIYTRNIQKKSGSNTSDNITNISFRGAEEMIKTIQEEAKKGNWEKSKLHAKVDEYKVHNKGGLIQLYIMRADQNQANTSNFIVHIIKDGQEVQKKALTAAPAKKSTTLYENQNFAWIKNEILVPFEIHVEEKTSSGVVWHQFLIQD